MFNAEKRDNNLSELLLETYVHTQIWWQELQHVVNSFSTEHLYAYRLTLHYFQESRYACTISAYNVTETGFWNIRLSAKIIAIFSKSNKNNGIPEYGMTREDESKNNRKHYVWDDYKNKIRQRCTINTFKCLRYFCCLSIPSRSLLCLYTIMRARGSEKGKTKTTSQVYVYQITHFEQENYTHTHSQIVHVLYIFQRVFLRFVFPRFCCLEFFWCLVNDKRIITKGL